MIVEPAGVNPTVTGAIRQAARATGTNFQYLLATAQVESNFNPTAQVATSSARGLFQFIEQTWLATLKEQGPGLGYGRFANAIARMPSGQYAVTDPRLQDTILNLRSDPKANAVMAGAFTRVNAQKLADALGRPPKEGELYAAHVLGPNGASKLIGLAATAPRQGAADIFPSAARANPTIFYDRQGRIRGAGEVYRLLLGRYDVARASQAAPTAVAASGTRGKPTDPAQLAETYAAAARISTATAKVDEAGPVFHSLFRTSARREAVAPVVSALWGAPTPVANATPAPAAVAQDLPPARDRAGAGLDLFQDQVSDARALFRGRV